MKKRAVIIVLDSAGIGEMPDAERFGDKGSNTIANTAEAMGGIKLPNMGKMGLSHIHPIKGVEKEERPSAAYGKAAEKSDGKDTVTGHWEMSGCILETPLKTFPGGFPPEIIEEFTRRTGREVLGNKVASGTEIIKELGMEHMKTGKPIVYTSADSVFQIAVHEDIIPLPELYKMCETAREMLTGDWTVGRVIARPFTGDSPENFKRTTNRHDYSLDPFCTTMLDYIKKAGMEVRGVGKISDIFNGRGVTHSVRTNGNQDGIDKTIEELGHDFEGLLFVNLVDFDMLYGHRNDSQGYGKALEEADERIPQIIDALKEGDLLIITADHGCDPTTESTDHSREYIPLLVYSKSLKGDTEIGTRDSFTDIAKTVLEYLGIPNDIEGKSFLGLLK